MEYMAAQADQHMSAGQSLYERMEAELIGLRADKAELLKAIDIVADGLSADARTMDGMTKATAAAKLRTAWIKATASATDAGVAG